LVDSAEPVVCSEDRLLTVHKIFRFVVEQQVLVFLLLLVVKLHGTEALELAVVTHHCPGKNTEKLVG
jgi:hypothetical protein